MLVTVGRVIGKFRRGAGPVGCLLLAAALSGCAGDTTGLLPPKEVGASAAVEPCADGSAGASGAQGARRTAAGKDCVSAGRAAAAMSPIQTGALPSPAQRTGASAADQVEELFVDFDPSSLKLSEKEERAFREAVAARLLSGDKAVRIFAARGGSGNLFDQVVVAEKRARLVNEMLPARMVLSVEVDPALPEDTVRIEFVKRSK